MIILGEYIFLLLKLLKLTNLSMLIKEDCWKDIEDTITIRKEGYKRKRYFRKVHEYLKLLKFKQSDITIKISLNDVGLKTKYLSVSGRRYDNKDGEKEECNISFRSWDEILGMQIEKQSLERFTKPEIVAACLFEMTWFKRSMSKRKLKIFGRFWK